MDEMFPEEEQADYKEAFALYDKEGVNKIPLNKLPCIMRSLGQNPSDIELEILEKQVDPDNTGMMEFDKFLTMMNQRRENVDIEDELLSAFRVFDKQKTGSIPVDDMRHILQNLGDKLTDEEVEEFLDEADKDGDGEVDYAEFVAKLMRWNDGK